MFAKIVAFAALLSASLFAQAPATSTQAPPAAALPDARGIINRHIEAIGGRGAVLAHKSMHAIGMLSIPASGMSGPAEIFAATNPDRVVVKISVQGIGDIVEGFDGTHGWSVSPMTGPMLKTGKELEQMKFEADLYNDLRDPKKYPTVKTVEKTTFDGRECYKLSLTRSDGLEDIEFYDAATGLRAGSITTRETPMGTVSVTSTTSGYKKFGDLMHPTTSSQKTMGIEQVITVSTVEYDKVDSAVFDPPAAIKALIK